jgi:hypothetical protein
LEVWQLLKAFYLQNRMSVAYPTSPRTASSYSLEEGEAAS